MYGAHLRTSLVSVVGEIQVSGMQPAVAGFVQAYVYPGGFVRQCLSAGYGLINVKSLLFCLGWAPGTGNAEGMH